MLYHSCSSCKSFWSYFHYLHVRVWFPSQLMRVLLVRYGPLLLLLLIFGHTLSKEYTSQLESVLKLQQMIFGIHKRRNCWYRTTKNSLQFRLSEVSYDSAAFVIVLSALRYSLGGVGIFIFLSKRADDESDFKIRLNTNNKSKLFKVSSEKLYDI